MGNPNTQTVSVPHLGGIDASYQMPYKYDSSKPTLVLVNSFTTDSELYKAQYENKQLTDAMNLISIEPLGHGQTRTKSRQFTYWDSAIMNLQVLEKLGIKKAYALGTSQGGWIVTRMALLAPDVMAGIIPLGTSMNKECQRTIDLGCWDGYNDVDKAVQAFWSKEAVPDFEVPLWYSDFLIDIGFGKDVDSKVRDFWRNQIKNNYVGEEGRQRIHMAAINLRDRDGLHARIADLECPVLWIHGTSDVVYSVANAKEELPLFKKTNPKLQVVEGGQHFLSFSHPEEIAQALLGFVKEK